MVTAVGLSAAVLIRSRRHGSVVGSFEMAWLVLFLVSALSLRFPFAVGRHGSVQAFLNVLKAALLGYYAVTCAALVVLLAYLVIRPSSLPGRAALQRPPVEGAVRHELPNDTGQLPRRQMPRPHEWPGWVLAGAVAGLVAGLILAVLAGPHPPHDAQSLAAGWLILFAIAAVCVAVPAALYRRYRSRRVVAVPPSLPGASTAADPAARD
jgi:hypothetical protein